MRLHVDAPLRTNAVDTTRAELAGGLLLHGVQVQLAP